MCISQYIAWDIDICHVGFKKGTKRAWDETGRSPIFAE